MEEVQGQQTAQFGLFQINTDISLVFLATCELSSTNKFKIGQIIKKRNVSHVNCIALLMFLAQMMRSNYILLQFEFYTGMVYKKIM